MKKFIWNNIDGLLYLPNASLGIRYFGGGARAPKISTQTTPVATPIQRASTPTKNQQEFERKNADIRRQRIMSRGRAGTILTEKVNLDDVKSSLLGRIS